MRNIITTEVNYDFYGEVIPVGVTISVCVYDGSDVPTFLMDDDFDGAWESLKDEGNKHVRYAEYDEEHEKFVDYVNQMIDDNLFQ